MQLIAPFFLFPGPDVTEVLLVRHAQVPEGATVEDAALTDRGYEQAEVLAEYLAATRINAAYASPAARAQATAAVIAKRQGLEVGAIDGLRDIDNRMPRELTPLEALTREHGEAEGTRRFEAMVSGGWSFDLFGGLTETSAEIRARVAGAVDEVVARHRGQRALLVSHGPPIAAYVAHVLQSPYDFGFYPRMTSITSVLAQGERRQVHLLNATPHLGVL